MAVEEAVRFTETGELPAGFSLDATPPKVQAAIL